MPMAPANTASDDRFRPAADSAMTAPMMMIAYPASFSSRYSAWALRWAFSRTRRMPRVSSQEIRMAMPEDHECRDQPAKRQRCTADSKIRVSSMRLRSGIVSAPAVMVGPSLI